MCSKYLLCVDYDDTIVARYNIILLHDTIPNITETQRKYKMPDPSWKRITQKSAELFNSR